MTTATIRSPRKRKGHGGERHQEILDAALGLISQRGVLAVSTRDIASAVGISQPALYAYFATRDDIMAELCEQAFFALSHRLQAVGGMPPGRVSLRMMCQAYISFGLENPNAYRVAFMIEKPVDPAHLDAASERALSAGVQTYGVFRTEVARFSAAGLTRDIDLDILTQSAWASLHGLVSLMIARPHFPWVDQSRLVEAHIEQLIDAMMA
ncbi:MAG: TetR/AcrR family transcriptional regulator [Caulobacteraceae bacterium]|nr:TetR/AcrR family transcriptional regulator [Caulobacteraceae bacterium]